MEKIYTDPLFWTAIVFLTAFIFIFISKLLNREIQGRKLFSIIQYEDIEKVNHIRNQYFHFGIPFINPADPSQNVTTNPTWFDQSNNNQIFYNNSPCSCTDGSKLFVETWQLTGQYMPTEGNNPPSSTISTPTGTAPIKKEGLGLNIYQNKQYNNADALSFSTHLPDQNINFANSIGFPTDTVKIAIIDTGVNLNGKSLAFRSGSELIGCGDFDQPDSDGHGTYVYYFTKVGLKLRGITNYKIYSYNASRGNGELVMDKVMCAMINAAEKGVKTINLSFGFYNHLPEFCHFINLFLQEYNDVKIICSAGNYFVEIAPYNGTNFSFSVGQGPMPHPTSYYHGIHPSNIYQITALGWENTPNTIQPCPFSNYMMQNNIGCQGSFRFQLNGHYCLIEGTSFASPIFAGYYANESTSNLNTIINGLLTMTPGNHKIAVNQFLQNEF